MKAIILGSGIIGTTTAYMLCKMGVEVTVIDKNEDSGLGCSFANGGQLSFSHSEPWFNKSSLFSLLKASTKRNSYAAIKDFNNPEFWKWSLRFIANSSTKNINKTSLDTLSLGIYSKIILGQIMESEKIDFNYSEKGILHFFRNNKALENAIKEANLKNKIDCKFKILTPHECVEIEPTLNKIFDENRLSGGILYEDDASGDPYAFIQRLKEICIKNYNANFIYDCQIKNLLTNHKEITGINTSKEVFKGDVYISALGAYSSNLLKGIDVDTKIYPLKGYSLSIPIPRSFLAPKISLTDSENKIVYSRLGNVFRAAGTIEACGLKLNKNRKNIEFIEKTIKATFSDFGDLSNSKEWFGFRPYRSDCRPLIGKIPKYSNLYINSGHGSLGWTNSFASSKILCDEIFGRSIDKKFSFLKKSYPLIK